APNNVAVPDTTQRVNSESIARAKKRGRRPPFISNERSLNRPVLNDASPTETSSERLKPNCPERTPPNRSATFRLGHRPRQLPATSTKESKPNASAKRPNERAQPSASPRAEARHPDWRRRHAARGVRRGAVSDFLARSARLLQLDYGPGVGQLLL